MMADGERIVDEFYSFWELLNDMARVGEKRLTTALTAQLTTTFWHPVICTALSSTYPELAIATTKYTTEMIKSLTDQTLLQSFLVILIGERGGVGKDLEPEVREIPNFEQEKEPVEEEAVETKEEAKGDQDEQVQSPKETGANQEETTLRRLLISRINQEPELLALCTLRLFDTILETYNQFAVYNLVLRNYLDITPDGKYVDETEEQIKSSSETLDGNEDKSVTSHDRGDDEASNADEDDAPVAQGTSQDNQKDPKVRWLVERYVIVSFIVTCLRLRCYIISFNRFILFRILSLLPLEDELERMKTPPVSSLITSEHHGHHMRPSQDSMHEKSFSENDTRSFDGSVHSSTSGSASLMVPGNSYDDYFVEAQERLQYGLLARNFWVTPYPPTKTQLDRDRELEDLRGRPKRKSMALTQQTLIEEEEPLEDEKTGDENIGEAEPKLEKAATAGHYEGLFLSVLFDEFAKILEASLERNLIITSILAKIVGIVDRRVEGVLCDFRAIRQGEDGTFYGGVWTLASGRGNRRSLYALLEQVKEVKLFQPSL